MAGGGRHPSIADYALIGDCNAAALVSRSGSIDWCCLPRFDSGSCFARLLDWDHGGFCAIVPDELDRPSFREYVDDTLVLGTTFRAAGGEGRVLDCFVMREVTGRSEDREILRVVEGKRGAFEFTVRVAPRFDYGEVEPWLSGRGRGVFTAIGGDDGLVVTSDAGLEMVDDGALVAHCQVRPGDRVRLSIAFRRPEQIDGRDLEPLDPEEADRRLERTLEWWREWAGGVRLGGPDAPGAARSAIVLKALTYAPTGAIAAAPTTSLPEAPGGSRNWDYRFAWIRDSALAVRSLAELGYEREADAFRRFFERSAAGSARDLQILYGVGGERRLSELELSHLEGYQGARPVRAGNDASGQLQLDAYGQLVDQSWRWHQRGNSPDDDYWRFLLELVEAAVERWREPDNGLWEWRGDPKHFVHSKVLCWAAVDRGLKLAEECMRKAPEARWRRAREEIREAVESEGYDERRGVFVQAFGERQMDAALLRLPTVGFLDYADERMVRTVDAIREDLEEDGLVWRYRGDDGLEGEEGAFLACSFWLVEVMARQGRQEEARSVFDRALSTANGLGLFSEEYDPDGRQMLGNFPQALTHLSHIEAALALVEGSRFRAGAADERASSAG
jgi:GH15 family glucan-1,4-alpha-glucosidase